MLSVTQASARGSRSYQEDRLSVVKLSSHDEIQGWLLAVLDGHNGSQTAQVAVDRLGPLFHAALARTRDVGQALDQLFKDLSAATSEMISGSTASVVFLEESRPKGFAAVLGDSPAAWLAPDERPAFGGDHNVRSNLVERAAAEARGGVVIEGYLMDPRQPEVGLQMARSLGDRDVSGVLSRTPELTPIRMSEERLGFVGSDGLLDPYGDPREVQLARLLTLVQQGADAAALVEDALRRQTGDNVSAIVWRELSGIKG